MNLAPGVLALLVIFAVLAVFRPEPLQHMLHNVLGRLFLSLKGMAASLRATRCRAVTHLRTAVSHGSAEGPGSLAHQLVGQLLFALFALGVLVGDAALITTTVCGMLGDGCASGLPMVNPSIALGLSLLASAAFTAMVVADLHKLTTWRKWPPGKGFSLLAHGAFFFSLILLVLVAGYREVMIAHVPTSAEELTAFLERTSPLRKTILIGGGLLIAVVSATAVVALATIFEVIGAALVAGPALLALWLLALVVSFAGWTVAMGGTLLHDMIGLVARPGARRLEQPRHPWDETDQHTVDSGDDELDQPEAQEEGEEPSDKDGDDTGEQSAGAATRRRRRIELV